MRTLEGEIQHLTAKIEKQQLEIKKLMSIANFIAETTGIAYQLQGYGEGNLDKTSIVTWQLDRDDEKTDQKAG